MTNNYAERIYPLSDIGPEILGVEKPARYLGGEFGSTIKNGDDLYTVALCFPDLYEIGMSNNAIRILYAGLNALPSVRCERVFAPAADFSALLVQKNLPLYTLESGIPLDRVDMIGFSVGYELCATNMLAVLDSGRIPLLRSKRSNSDPIVVAGGPAITNPHPFAMFLDAVYIGEAEAGFFDLVSELAAMKHSGKDRGSLLESIDANPSMWTPGTEGNLSSPGSRPEKQTTVASIAVRKHKKTVRAVFAGFGDYRYTTALPLPTTRTVQDHGTVEIMRGCPNGCRFCHAGYFYRPQRLKSPEVIFSEVERLIDGGGYREITLASLSSGDYPGIAALIEALNRRWSPRHVSFQLPSLKVDTFTLPLLESLSEVRKSGLTFAVETPVESWQASINKAVSLEHTLEILEEAKKKGFRQAKFYFMIGLPVEGFGQEEADEIIVFLEKICRVSGMSLSVNIGTFVPKPHTPFERSAQLSEGDALFALNKIKAGMRKYRNVKISYHSPFTSMLEGIFSRGDARVGEILLAAYSKGARLDAWEEHFDRELWRSVLDGFQEGYIETILSAKGPEESLYWNDVSLKISPAYLRAELEKANAGIYTSKCINNCTKTCGSCDDVNQVVNFNALPNIYKSEYDFLEEKKNSLSGEPRNWVVLAYRKKGIAAFFQHLSIVEFFSRAFMMNDIPIAFSEGFNPMPRIETTPPLSMGAESEYEVMQIPLISETWNLDRMVESLNRSIPSGLNIFKARIRNPQVKGTRHRSIGSLYCASLYRVESTASDPVSRILSISQVSAVLEGYGVQSVEHGSSDSVNFVLSDKNGGERNLIRILEKASMSRPVLKNFRVIRLGTFLQDEKGSLSDLYEGI